MNTYAKLTDGRLMVVWSDNIDEKTMHGYPADEEFCWDCELDLLDKWDYKDINEIYDDRYDAYTAISHITGE